MNEGIFVYLHFNEKKSNNLLKNLYHISII